MVRNFARILLIAVGAALIAFAIVDITKNIDSIKALVTKFKDSIPKDLSGIQAFLALLKNELAAADVKQILINFGLNIVSILAGLAAVLSGAFNRGGFWFTIFSFLLLGLFIADIVSKTKAGSFAPDKFLNTFLQLLKDTVLQIGYVVGFLLMRATRKQVKN